MEEERVQDSEEAAAGQEEADNMTDCARNEYELNHATQNLQIGNKGVQMKKVAQVQNKVTDQRTTMDTNSNRKQTTDS